MSTPTFTQTSSSKQSVRLYTELDPYYYTIDNRPLQDLDANSDSLSSAADAGRRATLIEALGLSSVLSGLVGSTTQVLGLQASATTISTVTVSPGALLYPNAISTGNTSQILRFSASPLAVVLNTPAPATLGRELTYLIQATSNDFSGSSTYPNFDGTNTFLPSTLLNGYLTLSVLVSAEADTGTSVAPTATPGSIPLYTVVSVSGAPLPVLSISATAPARLNTLVASEQWVTPTLGNSWVAVSGFQPVQYKRVGNRVVIRGSLQSGTAASTAFTLPAGYRPLNNNVYGCANGTTGTNSVTVSSTGAVSVLTSSITNLGLIEFWLD